MGGGAKPGGGGEKLLGGIFLSICYCFEEGRPAKVHQEGASKRESRDRRTDADKRNSEAKRTVTMLERNYSISGPGSPSRPRC